MWCASEGLYSQLETSRCWAVYCIRALCCVPSGAGLFFLLEFLMGAVVRVVARAEAAHFSWAVFHKIRCSRIYIYKYLVFFFFISLAFCSSSHAKTCLLRRENVCEEAIYSIWKVYSYHYFYILL